MIAKLKWAVTVLAFFCLGVVSGEILIHLLWM